VSIEGSKQEREFQALHKAVKKTARLASAAAPTTYLDITVLSGGPSGEREVSLASGQAVCRALAGRKHRVSLRDISPADTSALDRPADFVFIALHGEFGEDGTVQRMLDQRGIRYCGSDAEASALAMNKVAAKRRFLEAEINTPAFDVADESRIQRVASRWRTPVVVKPVGAGSSLDTFIAQGAGELREALERVVRKHGQALVEEYVKGPELTVGILGDQALPVCQIRTTREFYNYEAKYIDDDTEYLFEVDLPDALLARVQGLSVQAMRVLGCRDFGRADWMVDELTHEPFLLEINTIPGFTSHSLLPKAAARVGISFDELCQRIVDLGMERPGTLA
jgi:D-alanine-D-alanine ligase